jgi:cardiolipin synthase
VFDFPALASGKFSAETPAVDWLGNLAHYWPQLLVLVVVANLFASGHALLHKRDTRAATLWLGVIWTLPVLGFLLYPVMGVNRIRRRALKLRVRATRPGPVPDDLGDAESAGAKHLQHIARVVNRVVAQPLTTGNQIEPLINGDQAFPAMLAALDAAEKSIALCSYIFDNDETGMKFIHALQRAVRRGVQVRVLVDSAGARYSFPPITWKLRRAQIPFAKFLPTSLFTPWRVATINLRNHRKLLIVDGRIAFTGGMNLRHGNVLAAQPASPVQDLHFLLRGPITGELQAEFANDWNFTTGEILSGERWFPELAEAGNVIARVVPDGPDADFENARWTLLAALGEAQTSVKILTPYFLPDQALITALNLAAMRGVRVDIMLPAKNNLPFVHWASRALWWQVLERGCHLWLTPPPFDHSKLMIVDGHWVAFGSANWDARSLRLNFELNVEAYGSGFAQRMEKIFEQKICTAGEVSLAEADARPLAGKLRDAIARLFSPYL